MSKNPPLTEDHIRQSAEAEARHAAAQASRNSQLDYMIAGQRRQQAAAALEAIVGSEDLVAALPDGHDALRTGREW